MSAPEKLGLNAREDPGFVGPEACTIYDLLLRKKLNCEY